MASSHIHILANGPELLFPAGTTRSLLDDLALPILMCDGESLERLAAVSTYALGQEVRPRFLPVAVKDGWPDWSGWIAGETWLELDRIEWSTKPDDPRPVHRKAVLVFDRGRTADEVHTIRTGLEAAGAKDVRIFAWPDNPPVDTVGELVEAVGDAEFLKVLEVMTAAGTNVASLADAVGCGEFFAKDAGGLLYR